MVIDASALIAILCDEPDASRFEAALALDRCAVHKASIEVVAFDLEQAEVARDAHRRYGRGRHPAALNYGDCFSYALCATRGEALLFKGDDFGKTDLKSALG